MNAAILGYVLIALAVLNLIGLLLLFRRVGRLPAPVVKPAVEASPVAVDVEADPAPAALSPGIQPDQLASMLRRLENRLGDIEDQVRRAPVASAASEPGAASDRALALAQRLARQGATPQDIADTCGISLTEAELLHRLHAAR
ncbi:DUF2802 domain-containing protein [Luteibacter aegosomaticola]|uniref:DUF2802 domain-containing protein n=1 Tax=Luteibacter aegosomaticola TaxID=2911538 RepID=UPI001FF8F704|nr:DUF2802 domain-containing protein [Luteibacter aegosomaticola]UPG88990.1 DUF2802 domain-containing protein [Luteibacter aegosomaticola]